MILPKDQRRDFELLYAFCRQVDDIADDPNLAEPAKAQKLDTWAVALNGLEPLPEALDDMILRRDMDRRLFLEVVEGMRMDLGKVRYETFEQLKVYCWRVASAVGLLCMRLFGGETEAHRHYAESLGMALQMTNILRDVAEDASMGRIYLPEEDMLAFGLSREEILSGRPGKRFRDLMEFEAARADAFYAEALEALSARERRRLPAAEIMRRIYQDILRRMRKDGFRVYQCRYRVSRLRKLVIVLGCWLGWGR